MHTHFIAGQGSRRWRFYFPCQDRPESGIARLPRLRPPIPALSVRDDSLSMDIGQ